MNFDTNCWLSRGVIAVALGLFAIMLAHGVYGAIDLQDALIMWALFAVAFYGLVPRHIANWVFGLLLIVLVCTLVIMFPVHTIAVLLVAIFVFRLTIAI